MSTLHDAELEAMHIDRALERVTLGFRKPDGSYAEYRFRGVRAVRLTGLILQNVVSRIFLSPSELLSDEEIHRIVHWIFSGDDGRSMVDHQLVERSVADVHSGAMRLFYVDPSLGAEIGVICKSSMQSRRKGSVRKIV